MTIKPLRVAAVSYLNSVPLVWGLRHGPHKDRFQVHNTLPSQCADDLRTGNAGAGIIPSIEYQRIDDLKIVPGLSVSSSGPVQSVLLISKTPVERIRSVALDTSSRTSACLIQILMKRHYGIAPKIVPHAPDLDAMLAKCDAAMMIGDPALATDFPGLQVRDLAEDWRALTGLPFVFAFWAVRGEEARSDLTQAFQESAAYSMRHLEQIIAEETQRTGFTPELIRIYLTENIDFTLGEKNLEGLRLFYSMAHEDGLIPHCKPLEFL